MPDWMKPTIKDGFATPFRALSFLFSNFKLSRYFLIPFSINILLFGIGTYAFITYFGDLLHWLVSDPVAWYQYIIYYAAAIVLGLLFAITFVFGFTAVGNIIASPFNDVLSQKTEEIHSGQKIDEAFSFKVLVGDAQQAILNELKKLGLLVLVQITLLLLNFIPAVGSILYAILSPLWIIYFLSFEYLDYTLSRKRIPFGEKWDFIKENKGACFGMGAAFFFTTIIPFVNFFVMPIAVIGATLLYNRIVIGPVDPTSPEDDLESLKIEQEVDDVLSNL